MITVTVPYSLEYAAARAYLDRKTRKSHPSGKSDGKRWHPSEGEMADCCRYIRQPSAAWPWSLMLHCRTLPHILALTGADPKTTRRIIREEARQ